MIARLLTMANNIPQSVISLLARVIMAIIFFQSGLTKLNGWQISDSAIFLFENEYKLPLLNPVLAAHLAAMAELTMPVLLVLGLASRFAALALLCMTLVIQIFVYPDAYLTHGLWAVCLLTIVARGPGVFSLDHVLQRRFGLSAQPA